MFAEPRSRFSCSIDIDSEQERDQTLTKKNLWSIRLSFPCSCSHFLVKETNCDNLVFFELFFFMTALVNWNADFSSPIDKYTKVSFVCDTNKYQEAIKSKSCVSLLPEMFLQMWAHEETNRDKLTSIFYLYEMSNCFFGYRFHAIVNQTISHYWYLTHVGWPQKFDAINDKHHVKWTSQEVVKGGKIFWNFD